MVYQSHLPDIDSVHRTLDGFVYATGEDGYWFVSLGSWKGDSGLLFCRCETRVVAVFGEKEIPGVKSIDI